MKEKETVEELLIKALQNDLRDKDLNKEEDKSYGEEYLTQLKTACNSFLRKESFEVGQIVKWKDNLKNRRFPYKNQPAIVVSILDEPIVSTEDESASPYFLERLDIILGVISDKGTFLTFYYDSRRFEAY